MNARVEAVVDMAKTWPTEDQAELLDALFGLVSPASGELEMILGPTIHHRD